jgi:hypothetical protein
VKIRHLCLILAAIALVSIVVSPALACECRKPGRSPGWWKHQFKAHIEGKGKPHVRWSTLVFWTGKIDARATPPWFFGYPLPPVDSLDYDGDGSFTTDDAHGIFNDTNWNHMWTQLANWYNWAADRRPYWG